ncbi:hypothetical protein HaLaN_28636, partial [Haematococcus lacustris]
HLLAHQQQAGPSAKDNSRRSVGLHVGMAHSLHAAMVAARQRTVIQHPLSNTLQFLAGRVTHSSLTASSLGAC